jgi:hypothetical protein
LIIKLHNPKGPGGGAMYVPFIPPQPVMSAVAAKTARAKYRYDFFVIVCIKDSIQVLLKKLIKSGYHTLRC